MKKKLFVLLLIVNFLGLLDKVKAKEVSCERVENAGWGRSWFHPRTVKTCKSNIATIIEEDNVTISTRDDSILGLQFSRNKKIEFLPIRIAESFPNMIGYNAWGCSIKRISKKNFAGLDKLRQLYLAGNQIEEINSDTFEDLVLLAELWLSDNKIKFLNGGTFRGFNRLTGVWLSQNVCIDEDFTEATRIAVLQQTVNEKCRFEEKTISSNSLHELESELKVAKQQAKAFNDQIINLKAEIGTYKEEKLECKSEVSDTKFELNALNAANTKLEAELTSLNALIKESKSDVQAEKDRCQQQTDLIREFQLKLELQWNATCIAETKELRNNFDFKLQENDELNEKLQQKQVEINDKKAEIERLKKKNEFLLGSED